MKKSSGVVKNPISTRPLAGGGAKGGGSSGGNMKGGMSAVPKAPGSNNSSKPC